MIEMTSPASFLALSPATVAAVFEGPYTSQKCINRALALANNAASQRDMVEAGHLVIYNAIRSCGNLNAYLRVMAHRLAPVIIEFMEEHLSVLEEALEKYAHLNYRDHDFFSAASLVRGYLLRPTYGEEPWETPLQKNLRMATQFHHTLGIDEVLNAFLAMSEGFYTPASPTIFNAGTKTPQLSSCFLLTIGDSLQSILHDGVGDAGLISQHNGGLGIGLTRLRHSQIGDVGMSSGIEPVAKLYDAVVSYVDQGGKRPGAGTAFLAVWHRDIKAFIKLTDNFQAHGHRLEHLNTCVWLNRLFFKRVAAGQHWTVFCPAKAAHLVNLHGYQFEEAYVELEALAKVREVELVEAHQRLVAAREAMAANPTSESIGVELRAAIEAKTRANKARIDHIVYPTANEILEMIVEVQTRSGMPYMMNADAVNAKSNQANLGPVTSSNLCLEVCEVSTPDQIASCNLHSINLARPAVKPIVPILFADPATMASKLTEAYNFQQLGQAAQDCVKNLDQVINSNYYPLDTRDENGEVIVEGKISALNMRTRPLGIGVSGFDDALKIMNLTYEGRHAELFNKMVFACMYFNALVASVRLAACHGPYETFRTGTHQIYDGVDATGKIQWQTRRGSPLANGDFQFDLWHREANMLAAMGDLNTKIYDVKDDEPIDPKIWGQQPMTILFINADGLKEYVVIEPSWESLREKVMTFGVRHSLLLALMPTASTAQILRNAEGTEAHMSNIYSRNVISGSYTLVSRHLVHDLEEMGLWCPKLMEFIMACAGSVKHLPRYVRDHPHLFPSAFSSAESNSPDTSDMVPVALNAAVEARLNHLVMKYKTMFEISAKHVLKMARQRAIYVDQSQSLNVYIADPSPQQLKAYHSMAIMLGLKTGMYYLRQKPATDTASFTIGADVLVYLEKLTGTRPENATPPKQITAPVATFNPAGPICTRQEGCISCQ